jgi:mono/diheme cytochrome c family protein
LCLALTVVGACGDDDDNPSDAGPDGSAGNGGDGGPEKDSGTPPKDSGTPDKDAGPTTAELVARGNYLVAHVAACGDCHTPRKMDGSPDTSKLLSGVECFADATPADGPASGCLHSRNLTNHKTGLKNRSNQEIKDMFLKGERPDGKALHPVMPYWVFGNMSDEDADAIVAYLRTVKGVDHMVPPSQAPFLPPDKPAPRFPEAKIPKPRADYADRAAAERGRYLAGNVGICMECHTKRNEMGMVLVDKAFQGGEEFRLGIPVFPDVIYSSNITPDATGIKGWSVKDIVNALKKGEDADQDGAPLCPPMPAGPMGAFGGMSTEDATDIAHYLLSIPPGKNAIPGDCIAMPPTPPEDAGTEDAGN